MKQIIITTTVLCIAMGTLGTNATEWTEKTGERVSSKQKSKGVIDTVVHQTNTQDAQRAKNEEIERKQLNRDEGMGYKSGIDSNFILCVLMNDALAEGAYLQSQLGRDNSAKISQKIEHAKTCKAEARRKIKFLLKHSFPELEQEAFDYYSSFIAAMDNSNSPAHVFAMETKKSQLQARMDFLLP